jgi:hypothetical protein
MTKRDKRVGDLAVPGQVQENVRGGKDKKKAPPTPPTSPIGGIIGGPVIGTQIGGSIGGGPPPGEEGA